MFSIISETESIPLVSDGLLIRTFPFFRSIFSR